MVNDPLFNFFLASVTYHGDFIDNKSRLLSICPKGWTEEKARNEGIRIYKTFYNYSDENFAYALKQYKSAKTIYKFFYEHSDLTETIRNEDEHKKHFIEDFYQQCL